MIRISKAAERYSTALFQVVKSDQLLDQFEHDMGQLALLVSETSHFLTNPLIAKNELQGFLTEISKKLNLHKVTTSFLLLLAQRRRIDKLPQILARLSTLLMEAKGQLAVDVRSNSDMSSEQVKKIKDALSAKTGREILMKTSVDKNLLGGIVINYGSYKLDFSLRRKLNELKHELERLG